MALVTEEDSDGDAFEELVVAGEMSSLLPLVKDEAADPASLETLSNAMRLLAESEHEPYKARTHRI